MRKFRYIWVPIYQVHIHFIKCSRGTYLRQLKNKFRLEYEVSNFDFVKGHSMSVIANDVRRHIIWVSEWRYLSHEIFHCVHRIFKNKGFELCDESQEAYAYLIQYLDEAIRPKIRKK